jgi:hypothetical protein
MITFNDLKQNTLLKAKENNFFRVYLTNHGFGVLNLPFNYLIDKDMKTASKYLILLSELESKLYYKAWLCFCSGKICIFSISSYELNFLVKVYDST